MPNYSEMLATRIWSYSSVNTYYNCPKSFKLQYIDKVKTESNAFAEWGSLCHKILEMYYKDKYSIFELQERYLFDYPTFVSHEFPYSMGKTYFKSGQNYFKYFDNKFANYEIVAVEQEIIFSIGKYKFKGFIDLVLKKDDEYYICDHKSKKNFNSKQELYHYMFQLYLYSKYIYEKYGKYPKGLIFNLIRSNEIVEVPFDFDHYQKSLNWAEFTIKQICEDEVYFDKIFLDYIKKNKDISQFRESDFFCNFICSVRLKCNRSACFEREEDS